MRIRSAVVALAALCWVAPVAADPRSDTQGWSAVALSGPVAQGSRFLLWFDGHARFRDDIDELGVSILRPGIGWQLTDSLRIWAGYARVTSHIDGPNIYEDRAWQQAIYPLTEVLGGRLGGRTRLEQRFRKGEDVGHRLRQFLRWSRPLGSGPWSAVAWDEVFVSFNNTDWGQRDGFDQNRAFVGLGWAPTDLVRVEAGYLNNYLRVSRDRDFVNHNVSLTLFLNLP